MFFNDFGVPGTPKSDLKSLKSGFLGLLDALMDSRAALGALFGPTCLFFGRLGTSSAALGPLLGSLGCVLERLVGSLGASWNVLGRSWDGVGVSWGCLGLVWGALGLSSGG